MVVTDYPYNIGMEGRVAYWAHAGGFVFRGRPPW